MKKIAGSAGRKMRTLTVILQHIGRYFDRYVRQSSPDAFSKACATQFQFVVESHSESFVASTESRCGTRTEIDRYLRRAD